VTYPKTHSVFFFWSAFSDDTAVRAVGSYRETIPGFLLQY